MRFTKYYSNRFYEKNDKNRNYTEIDTDASESRKEVVTLKKAILVAKNSYYSTFTAQFNVVLKAVRYIAKFRRTTFFLIFSYSSLLTGLQNRFNYLRDIYLKINSLINT